MQKLIFLMVLGLNIIMPALAATTVESTMSTLPSCEEITQAVNTLEEVTRILEQNGRIVKDSELDKALGEIIEDLEAIAQVESNEPLQNNVAMLRQAWNEMRWYDFKDTVKSIILNLNHIHTQDCT